MARDPAERPSASELLKYGCSQWQAALRGETAYLNYKYMIKVAGLMYVKGHE